MRPQGRDDRFTQQAAISCGRCGKRRSPPWVAFPEAGLRCWPASREPICSPVPRLPYPMPWPPSGRRWGRVAQGSAAALQVQIVFDLGRGGLQGLLQSGRAPDKYAPTQDWNLPKGALKIADLGYFSVSVLAR
jgi:hypothetical protein